MAPLDAGEADDDVNDALLPPAAEVPLESGAWLEPWELTVPLVAADVAPELDDDDDVEEADDEF